MSNNDREFRTRLAVLERAVADIKQRLDELEQWRSDVDNVLNDHETRIAALETP